jgi:hypothetical protein
MLSAVSWSQIGGGMLFFTAGMAAAVVVVSWSVVL